MGLSSPPPFLDDHVWWTRGPKRVKAVVIGLVWGALDRFRVIIEDDTQHEVFEDVLEQGDWE